MDGKKLITALIILGTMSAMFYMALRGGPSPVETVQVASFAPAIDSILPSPPSPPQPVPSYSGTVGKNVAFFDLLQGCGFTPQQISEISRAAKPVYDFRRIYPGQSYEIFTDPGGGFSSLRFTVSDEAYIEVTSGESGMSVKRELFPFEIATREASGLISQSLFASLSAQDLPVELGIKLADIFAWDIDFFSQIRKNDYFRVIYEQKKMLDGPDDSGSPKIGNILAAEFNTSGENHYAFLFESDKDFPDYYDDEGKSLRKQLLRAPLNYTRISSSYNRRRLHPVHKTYMPHLGIDYSAPTGTPVMSTGDGTIMTASRTRSNGNYIKVRHNSNYISYYLHLSRFAKGIRQGVAVKQGQVIGYVGATGVATGPHLDYRVKKNGKFVNPRKLKLPPAKPVVEERMAAYLLFVEEQIASLRKIPIIDPRTANYADESLPPDTRSSAAD